MSLRVPVFVVVGKLSPSEVNPVRDRFAIRGFHVTNYNGEEAFRLKVRCWRVGGASDLFDLLLDKD